MFFRGYFEKGGSLPWFRRPSLYIIYIEKHVHIYSQSNPSAKPLSMPSLWLLSAHLFQIYSLPKSLPPTSQPPTTPWATWLAPTLSMFFLASVSRGRWRLSTITPKGQLSAIENRKNDLYFQICLPRATWQSCLFCDHFLHLRLHYDCISIPQTHTVLLWRHRTRWPDQTEMVLWHLPDLLMAVLRIDVHLASLWVHSWVLEYFNSRIINST